MYCQGYVDRLKEKMQFVQTLYEKRIYRPIIELKSCNAYETKKHLRVPPVYGYKTINAGETWGEEWGNCWFTFSFTVPDSAKGKTLYIVPNTSAYETLCFINGKPAGIVNSKNDFLGGMHSALYVCSNATPGDTYNIALECYAGHYVKGQHPYDKYGTDDRGSFACTFNFINVCYEHTATKNFCYDLSTALMLSDMSDTNFISKKAYDAVYNAYTKIIQDVENHTDEEIDSSCENATKALAPALEKVTPETSRGHVGILGHSHMDTAWLWTIDETIRKCARTYSEVLSLMERYPEYTFIQSSTLHLDWMKKYYPDIFEGIKKRVKEGRYEPNGGVWIECDGNITSGESMIRQFMYGQRFTRENFGYTSDTFWLADTFGYSPAIPQIMKGCDVKYFCTTKMYWNDLNRIPLDTFVWKGNDGSEVLTHFNLLQMSPNVKDVNKSIDMIRVKSDCDKRLLTYGFGDGGGGPTEGMLEYARRTIDLPGIPEIHHTTASQFMRDLEKDKDKYPVYDGELYLERHRGTLTSIHDIKKNNRKAELALHNLEFLNVLTDTDKCESLDDLYKVLLQNQFHDILPGSALTEVNERAKKEVSELIKDANNITNKYVSNVVSDTNDITLVNAMPYNRTASMPFEIDYDNYSISNANTQLVTDANGKKKLVVSGLDVNAYATKTFKKTEYKESASKFAFENNKLETPFYSAVLDNNGYIISLIDKRANRVITQKDKSPLGMLYFGENFPSEFDNWEIEADIFDVIKPVESSKNYEIISNGSVEFRIRNEFKLSNYSSATVDTIFYYDSPQIDYDITLNWNDKHSILKACFDVNVKSPFIKNEIQFGYIERPTTKNNTLECAKFEVCNHKYSDLSESRYGVAILNDCKYGISCDTSRMMLTLQKSGTHPDITGDPGIHTMRYSLLPHVGTFSADNTVSYAYAFNSDPILVNGKAKVENESFIKVDASNIICETIKKSEDDNSAYVIRLYECERNTTNCKVKLSRKANNVFETNMLEEIKSQCYLDEDNTIDLTFKPFEIKTLLIK